MIVKILCLIALLASSHADTGASLASTINGHYSNYRHMDDQRLHSELLILWVSTVGDENFSLKEQISASCKQLATAAADVWQDLPTLELVAPLIDTAISTSIKDVRSAQPTNAPHPMEKVCHHLEQGLQLDPTVNTKFLRFQRQPKSTPPELATNAKRLSGNPTIPVNQVYARLLSAPRVGRLIAHGMFVSYVRSRNCALADYRLSKAIVESAQNAEFLAQAQLTYEKALYDTAQFALEILDRDKNNVAVPIYQIMNGALMARVRDNFQKDAKLWTAIESAQKVLNTTVCKGTQ